MLRLIWFPSREETKMTSWLKFLRIKSTKESLSGLEAEETVRSAMISVGLTVLFGVLEFWDSKMRRNQMKRPQVTTVSKLASSSHPRVARKRKYSSVNTDYIFLYMYHIFIM